MPLFNLIRCENCNVKVCYRYDTSDLVKCTKCGYVNKVSKRVHTDLGEIQRGLSKEEVLLSQRSVEELMDYPDLSY